MKLVRQVMEGEIRASFVLALIQRLPEGSMTKARQRGGDAHWAEHIDFSRTEMVLADLYDALNLNTQATGQWKKKAPDLPSYPRPKSKKKNKPITVEDLHKAWMGKVMRDAGKGAVLDD